MAQELIRRFVVDVQRVEAMPAPVYDFGALQVEAGQDADLRPSSPVSRSRASTCAQARGWTR